MVTPKRTATTLLAHPDARRALGQDDARRENWVQAVPQDLRRFVRPAGSAFVKTWRPFTTEGSQVTGKLRPNEEVMKTKNIFETRVPGILTAVAVLSASVLPGLLASNGMTSGA